MDKFNKDYQSEELALSGSIPASLVDAPYTMSLSFKLPYQMEVGTIFRSGDIVYVVIKVRYDEGNTKLNMSKGWSHLVRAATEDEKTLSDVLQT